MDETSFGAWIKSARLAVGLTLSEAAERAGISINKLSAIEHDSQYINPRRFNLSTIEGLARALGMHPFRITWAIYDLSGGWNG